MRIVEVGEDLFEQAGRGHDDVGAEPAQATEQLPVGRKLRLAAQARRYMMGCVAFEDNFPKRDNPAVWALRQAGAVILAKTTTAELGGSHPPATTNPFDSARTAGGSSSGSAAAVAARMLPAAIGTQVGGSIIRPAAYCGNFALKPTQGGINRGERQATSMSTHGVHAGCIEDMWQVAIEIVSRAGGDRGCVGLTGPMVPPEAVKPQRLMVLETEGHARLDEPTRNAFAQLLQQLERAGVTLLTRRSSADVEALERAIGNATAIASGMTGWENRWGTRNLVDQHPHGVSARAKAVLAKAEAMSVADYRALLREREAAQAVYAAMAGVADAAITLSCPGVAPLWSGDEPGKPLIPRPTGDAVFNYPSSMLFAPAVTVPLLAVGGMPVGVQLMGQPNDDARIVGRARWVAGNVNPVLVV